MLFPRRSACIGQSRICSATWYAAYHRTATKEMQRATCHMPRDMQRATSAACNVPVAVTYKRGSLLDFGRCVSGTQVLVGACATVVAARAARRARHSTICPDAVAILNNLRWKPSEEFAEASTRCVVTRSWKVPNSFITVL